MDYEGFSYGGGKRYGGFGQVYGGEDDAAANERRMREDAERYAGMSPDALESELIAGRMAKALEVCDDYDRYMEEMAEVKRGMMRAARERMGEQARHIAEQQFARRVAYQSTVDLIDQLVECWRAG